MSLEFVKAAANLYMDTLEARADADSDGGIKIFISGLKRELPILDLISVDLDITGTIEEVTERLKSCKLYVVNEEEYEQMKRTYEGWKSLKALTDSIFKEETETSEEQQPVY